MLQNNLPRLAVSCILAVLGFVALHNACGILPDVIIWWLLYTVACGIVIHPKGRSRIGDHAVLAILPALTPVLVLLFFVIAEHDICYSVPNQWAAVALLPASWFAIFIFSFSKAPILAAIKYLGGPTSKEKLDRIFRAFSVVVAGVIACVMALAALGHG